MKRDWRFAKLWLLREFGGTAVNRVQLLAACVILAVAFGNWGMAQTPPPFATSPFHRFGATEQEG